MKCDFPHQLFCKHSNCFEHFPLVRLYNIEATGHKQALSSFPSPLVDHPQLASFSAPHIPLTYHSFSSLKLPRFSTVSVSNMAAFSFYHTMSVHLSGPEILVTSGSNWVHGDPCVRLRGTLEPCDFLCGISDNHSDQQVKGLILSASPQNGAQLRLDKPRLVWSSSPPLSPPLLPPPPPQTAQDFILF